MRQTTSTRRWAVMAVAMGIALLCIVFSLRAAKRAMEAQASGPDLSHRDGWTAFGGDWAVTADGIQNNSEERGAKLIAGQGAGADYAVQADLQMQETAGEAGLIVRSSGEEDGVDAYHGYFAGIRSLDGTLEFGRADFGWHRLIQKSLPPGADLLRPVHLKVVAVGCSFGISVGLADGRVVQARAEDPQCMRQGRVGVRSSMSSARWQGLKVSTAGLGELQAITRNAGEQREVQEATLFEPDPTDRLARYAASIRAEAEKHSIQPGVQPIVDFLLAPGRHPDAAIQGIVISTPPLTDIQDESGAMIVPHVDPKTPLRLGDVVEARGTVISERFRSRLEDAKIRVLWSETPVPRLAVTAAQLTGGTYRGRAIEVEGVLKSARVTPGNYDLELEDGEQVFRAVGSKSFQSDPSNLEIGSRLRLRGTATSLFEFTQGIYPFTVIADRIDVMSAPPWWSPRHIAVLMLVCAGVLLAAQLLLHKVQQWHMRTRLEEREQLAYEMHDTLAQSFTGIAYQLQAASMERRGPDMTQAHVRSALEMVHASHREASRTIAALRPQYRDPAGILSALKALAERLKDGGGLAVITALNGKDAYLPLEVTDAFFRIGQEAISNAIQHGHCKTLHISLRLTRREAQLSVQDDGLGFATDQVEGGLGVESMRARALKVGAQFALTSVPGVGTYIKVTRATPLARGWVFGLRAKLAGTFGQGASS